MSRSMMFPTNDSDMPKYGASDWSDLFAALFGEGILKGWGNEFNLTIVGTTATVGSGAGMVDGKFRSFPTTTNFPIPTPTADTNHRIVLRIDPNAVGDNKISVVFKQGINGDPSVPNVTQVRGGMFEWNLWSIKARPNGTVDKYDERAFAVYKTYITATQMQLGVVGNLQLGSKAVHAANVGNGVSKSLYRLGAQAGTNWSASARIEDNTLRTREVGEMISVEGTFRARFDQGVQTLTSITIPFIINSAGTNYSTPFASAPLIFIEPREVTGITATNYFAMFPLHKLRNVTANQFDFAARLNEAPIGGYADFDFAFYAIGPAL